MSTPPPPARILAIETSGRHGSVAVASGPTLLATRELPPTSRHAIGLMPAIAELTREQGWQPQDLDHLYLSLGPGSFTGLRIAVAIAHALHQASGGRLKLVGVPSLDVIAQNAPESAIIVLSMLDAKRGQVFAARHDRSFPGTTLSPFYPASLVDPAAFLEGAIAYADELSAQTGMVPVQIALLGEGIEYHRAALAQPHVRMNVEVVELPKDLWHGRAAALHRLGYERAQQGQFSDAATLLPIYIRLPEAEEVYRKKHGLPLH